jgi:hypothetical protein
VVNDLLMDSHLHAYLFGFLSLVQLYGRVVQLPTHSMCLRGMCTMTQRRRVMLCVHGFSPC